MPESHASPNQRKGLTEIIIPSYLAIQVVVIISYSNFLSFIKTRDRPAQPSPSPHKSRTSYLSSQAKTKQSKVTAVRDAIGNPLASQKYANHEYNPMAILISIPSFHFPLLPPPSMYAIVETDKRRGCGVCRKTRINGLGNFIVVDHKCKAKQYAQDECNFKLTKLNQ
jgi:hypothetical protein